MFLIMSCKKYTIKNTSNNLVTFSYQRCDDYMWMYQVELNPNQSKNIWVVGNLLEIPETYSNNITLTDLGSYPATTLPPTPSITRSLTPTPIATSTMTPTQTTTQTGTPNFSSYSYNYIVFAQTPKCSEYPDQTARVLYASKSTWVSLSYGDGLFYDRYLTEKANSGWYSNGSRVLYINGSGIVDSISNCIN